LVFSYWSDNIGRKKSILISISICVLGNIIVSANTNLILASFGLLLSGAGANASINTTLCFFN
jgi:MFS family permease